jgi:7,8-dihydropterin-6-yl-methyl-4-(beta-D-ribofuranosyl)aminobenzene 5'-phosphate synthase
MCTEPHHHHPGTAAAPRIHPEPASAPADPITLATVDAVMLTTLVDNSTDLLLADQGPVHRHGLLAAAGAPRLATNVLDTGETYDIPLAEHGFSMLVTVARNGHDHHLLFDAGMTPDGLSENMRRLGLSPFDIELVVLSHGHSDHVTGLDGFIRTVGPANLPLVVHPGAFTKRRIAIPGLFELELPSGPGHRIR